MALDTAAFLDRVVTLLQSAAGVQNVNKGAPESWSNVVTVYAAVGAQRIIDKTSGGNLQRQSDVYVEFGYRVAGAEATAEDTLADYLDSFITGFYTDRKTHFTGVAESGWLDLSLAGSPDYVRVAGKETRTYPLIATAVQQVTV